MEPTPALWALLLWTWRPVANRMPSFTVTERCEKEAISSSFQPGYKDKRTVTAPSFCPSLPHSPSRLSVNDIISVSCLPSRVFLKAKLILNRSAVTSWLHTRASSGLRVKSFTSRGQPWSSCKPHCWDLANSPVIFGFTAPLN